MARASKLSLKRSSRLRQHRREHPFVQRQPRTAGVEGAGPAAAPAAVLRHGYLEAVELFPPILRVRAGSRSASGCPGKSRATTAIGALAGYRASVRLPAKLPGALYVYLGEVNKTYRIFINGKEATHSRVHWPRRLTYTDIAPYVMAGRQNEIVLRVEPGEPGERGDGNPAWPGRDPGRSSRRSGSILICQTASRPKSSCASCTSR